MAGIVVQAAKLMLGYKLVILLLCNVSADYRRPYPVTGTWFKDRTNVTDIRQTLSAFKALGGDTALSQGAEFLNRTSDSIKGDPLFKDCVVGGKHCVDLATEDLKTGKGLDIQAWVTYSYEDDYTENIGPCKGFDQRYQIGKKVFYRLVLWLEPYMGGADCTFKNGSRVAVLFTSFSGKEDPHKLLIQEATKLNMTVYIGLPKPPYIGEDQDSADLMQAFYGLSYRIPLDHQRRYSTNNETKAMKGYYSSATVIPDYIVNPQKTRPDGRLPPRYAVMFWRELGFLTGNAGYQLLGSPRLDLTHVGNTTLKGYNKGIQSLAYFGMLTNMVILDGRGEGKAAYFSEQEKHKRIIDTDYSLWQVLKHKNSSISKKVTYSDVYYASIGDFFRYIGDLKIPTWLMLEAFDDTGSKDVCLPVDPKASGMDRKVQKVFKSHLDRALTYVGALVHKVSAFAWDPLFTCKEKKSDNNLVEQIKNDYQRPIISECRFHSPQNQSIVVLGFHLEGPLTQPFQVNYTLYSGVNKSISLYGYYFELDYGQQHDLVDSLVYIQLYDIPDLRDLKRNGTIGVARTDGTGEGCYFNYNFNDAFTQDINNQEDLVSNGEGSVVG